jgi:Secretion system C-terminal sorting domain
MIYNKPGLTKRFSLLLVMLPFVVSVQSQTIVQVMVDQPEKFEVLVTDELYTQTDNALIFGENINISGGLAPFQYTWYKDDQVIGSNSVLEIPPPFISGLYSVLVTDANNCSVKLVATNTSDENADLLKVSVYPVPASKSITIDPNDIPGVLNVTFYNSNGSIMMRQQITGVSRLNINFPAGIYHIKVENNAGQLIGWRKIVVL